MGKRKNKKEINVEEKNKVNGKVNLEDGKLKVLKEKKETIVKEEFPSKIFKEFIEGISKLEYVKTQETTVANELALKVGGKFYGYLYPCKSYTFGIQRFINNHWKTERITTSEEAKKLINKLAEYKDHQKITQRLMVLGLV